MCNSVNQSGKRFSFLVSSSNIKKNDFISTLLSINGSELNGIPGIPEIYTVSMPEWMAVQRGFV